MPHPPKPCQWNGLNFASIAECAKVLHVQRCTVREHLCKYGNLDKVKPGQKSEYYKPPPKKVYQSTHGLHHSCKPITWRNKTFTSRIECAVYLGYTIDYVVDQYSKKGTIDHLQRKEAGTQCTNSNKHLIYEIPVVWRDTPFINLRHCADALKRDLSLVSRTWHKFNGNVDSMLPDKASVYYSRSEDYDYQDCFVAEAVSVFGVKAVARAFGTGPKRVRERRDNNTLWKFRIPRWDATEIAVKFKSRDELFQALVEPPRRPYVYMLVWTKTNMRYVGSRTAEYCTPSELNKTYFSSSARVAKYIETHGKPDQCYHIEYPKVTDALLAEGFCLMLLSASPNYIKYYFNKVLWIPNRDDPWRCRGTRNDFIVRCGDGQLTRKRQLLELVDYIIRES